MTYLLPAKFSSVKSALGLDFLFAGFRYYYIQMYGELQYEKNEIHFDSVHLETLSNFFYTLRELLNRIGIQRNLSERVRERRRSKLKESTYKSYDELPLFLNAETIAKVLGISISSCYELMHEDGFPSLSVGSRIVVPKEKFIEWVELNTGRRVAHEKLFPSPE